MASSWSLMIVLFYSPKIKIFFEVGLFDYSFLSFAEKPKPLVNLSTSNCDEIGRDSGVAELRDASLRFLQRNTARIPD